MTDTNQTRITAFWVLIFTAIYLLSGVLIWPGFLAFDFGLRSFGLVKFSPLTFISRAIINGFDLDKKLVDNVSKTFAARIGFFLSSSILILSYFGYIKTTGTLASVLFFFAFIESSFSICIGCYLYKYFKNPNLLTNL